MSSEKLEGLRSRVLISCAIASFLTPFSSSSIAFLLPEISSHFGVEVALSNWSATAYLLALASSMVPFGRIADWKGRAKVFRAGLVIFTISSIATILVRDFGSFIALRVLHGLGSSMISATSVALISSIFREGRGKAIGINTAAVYIGLSLGPLSAGLLSDLIILDLNIPSHGHIIRGLSSPLREPPRARGGGIGAQLLLFPPLLSFNDLPDLRNFESR